MLCREYYLLTGHLIYTRSLAQYFYERQIMTEILCYDDSYLREFDATVIDTPLQRALY